MKNQILMIILIAGVMGVQRDYILQKQNDPLWANILMGKSTTKISDGGAVITCVSMILDYAKIPIGGNRPNPQYLNSYLTDYSGYINNDQFVWDSLKVKGLNYAGPFSAQSAQDKFNNNFHVILHVENESHYVLMTGMINATDISVNDPKNDKKSYALTDVQGIQAFNPTSASSSQQQEQKIEIQ